MEKYINEHGKEYWSGVTPETIFSDLTFQVVPRQFADDQQEALHTNLGSLTVLDRMTGFRGFDVYGVRDTETGFRDMDGKFWLASGMCDVRDSGAKTIQEAIDWVKAHANTCVPDET